MRLEGMKGRSWQRSAWRGAILASLVLLLVAALPAQGAASLTASGSIAGIVRGPGGLPVAQATVAAMRGNGDNYAAAALTQTGPDGSFCLRDLPAGDYALTATSSHLEVGYHRPIKLAAGESLQAFVLTQGQDGTALSGVVLDGARKQPVPQAQVRIVEVSGTREGAVFHVSSGARGEYVANLPRGLYIVLPAAPGFDGESQRIQLDQAQRLDLRLVRPYPAGPAPPAVLAWIKSNAIPLSTLDVGRELADLEPLRPVVGDAEVVALGEASHGTREFFALKRRLIEFLVERLGFTVIGIEAQMVDCFDVNEYVLSGKGDPVKALAGMFNWPWLSQDMLDLLHWMRRYNADPQHPRKVKFYGIDMMEWQRTAKYVLSYLEKIDPRLASRANSLIAPTLAPFAPGLAELPAVQSAALSILLRDILAHLDQHQTRLELETGRERFLLARQHARLAQQQLELRVSGRLPRGAYMAENILWIRDHEGPGTRMIVWAHNGHVSKQGSMGASLRTTLKSRLRVFGLLFQEGSISANVRRAGVFSGPLPQAVEAGSIGSLDQTLAAAGLTYAALDLRSVPLRGEVGEFWGSFHRSHNIGAGYLADEPPGHSLAPILVGSLYDAILFVNRSTPLRLLPGHNRLPSDERLPTPTNLDFEVGAIGQVPPGWETDAIAVHSDWRIALTEEAPRQGKRCAVLRRGPGRHYGSMRGRLYQTIDAAPFRGKTLRLRVAARSDLVGAESLALLWLNIKASGASGTMHGVRQVSGSSFQDYEIRLSVPMTAQSITYGALMDGDGQTWLDAFSLDAVD